ncbi:hypothetical protein DAI22_02g344300 [Oryza sativa Japonica Group]|uniref:cDNA clone:J013055M02, full insert sequence n=1 Tax=Oryza sativa subsp. japonica TaxID=39947 RepID=B7EBW4_ORYSJ|nr:hypothetical protein DAI22_02g344300 [Oryza sativa Japonica Group]BAG89861.1 unnamed protein product [Oryza sativa Japonica Group]
MEPIREGEGPPRRRHHSLLRLGVWPRQAALHRLQEEQHGGGHRRREANYKRRSNTRREAVRHGHHRRRRRLPEAGEGGGNGARGVLDEEAMRGSSAYSCPWCPAVITSNQFIYTS